jgi:protein-S-isoprenylcysteine O-methyltransferase Ste14
MAQQPLAPATITLRLVLRTALRLGLVMGAYAGLLLALLLVSALDAGRFGRSAVRAAAWAAMAAAGAWIYYALATNTYRSRMVRIQDDRGHHVVSRGPYRVMRHPMYAALVVLFPAVPLALGSWWGLIPAAACVGLFVLRTALEDRTLQRELDGYPAYAQRVRYRLIPGLW